MTSNTIVSVANSDIYGLSIPFTPDIVAHYNFNTHQICWSMLSLLTHAIFESKNHMLKTWSIIYIYIYILHNEHTFVGLKIRYQHDSNIIPNKSMCFYCISEY